MQANARYICRSTIFSRLIWLLFGHSSRCLDGREHRAGGLSSIRKRSGPRRRTRSAQPLDPEPDFASVAPVGAARNADAI
jgi:hypothetical protein